jgi:hypothetical protein
MGLSGVKIWQPCVFNPEFVYKSVFDSLKKGFVFQKPLMIVEQEWIEEMVESC